ncbi:MAG TPA: LysE family translocator [Actinomycetota bacterium]|nr:LysE family translocator [Actinomycetota bacterium]
MISAVVGFAVVAGLLTMLPGIDTALVLRASIIRGPRAAYATVAGICTGLLVWGVAAAIGVTAILAASQVAFEIVRWAGAVYLVGLGITLLWQSRSADRIPTVAADVDAESAFTSFRRGLLTNLLNPKIGVFYMAVLPQFIPVDASALSAGVVLALVHVVESIIWFSLLIWGTRLLKAWLERTAVKVWLDRITGGVLVGFGIKVALTR